MNNMIKFILNFEINNETKLNTLIEQEINKEYDLVDSSVNTIYRNIGISGKIEKNILTDLLTEVVKCNKFRSFLRLRAASYFFRLSKENCYSLCKFLIEDDDITLEDRIEGCKILISSLEDEYMSYGIENIVELCNNRKYSDKLRFVEISKFNIQTGFGKQQAKSKYIMN